MQYSCMYVVLYFIHLRRMHFINCTPNVIPRVLTLCSLCLSSHGAVTAGRQLLVVDKAMQWFMEGLEAYS